MKLKCSSIKTAVILSEVVPFSDLKNDPDFIENTKGIQIPESAYVLDEAGEDDIPPMEIDQYDVIGQISVVSVRDNAVFTGVVTGYKSPDGRVYVFPESIVLRAASLKTAADSQEGVEGLTSTSLSRDKDIEKKKFLVELEMGLADSLSDITQNAGLSRNLLMNLLVQYFIKNKTKVLPELMEFK